ncbi:MAG: hypothetical protein K2X91_18830, partial [Thermoleophilia bacterium]|nr:hypothetical protein [Thermoleophilia bacterium]
ALNWFRSAQQPIATPAIVAGPAADLYVVLIGIDPATGSATFRVMLRPLVSWIWPGGILAALGGLLAFWPVRRAPPAASRITQPVRTQPAVSDP